jgi:outer membrane protein OmpA-like peptidoglycan-associated protein
MNRLFVFFLFFLPHLSTAQNLVANGSFEDTSRCSATDERCYPAGWLYIKKRSVNGFGQLFDGIPAYDGDRKLCFTVGNGQNKYRTYWETILLKALQKGVRYKLTMYIHGWDNWPNLNDLGIWFVDSLFFIDSDTLLQPSRYLDILHATVKEQKSGWFRIEQEFAPERNVQYLLLGNFSPKDYQRPGQERGSRSFYLCDFVDAIRIEPVTKAPCAECPGLRDSIYLVAQQLLSQACAPSPPDRIVKTAAKTIDTLEVPPFLFAFNSATMADSNGLDPYTAILCDPRVRKIIVAGYADSTGRGAYNIGLAEKRAQAVAGQLQRRFHIDAAVVEAIGRGVSYKFKEKEQNRRVEIYVYRE